MPSSDQPCLASYCLEVVQSNFSLRKTEVPEGMRWLHSPSTNPLLCARVRIPMNSFCTVLCLSSLHIHSTKNYILFECPSKSEAPVCVYCAGHHKSSDCPDKSNPKCANCSSRAAPGVSCSHYALSPDCPMMALQRNVVIEGTDLVSSKNL